jgi:hypothetical protein
MFSLGSSGGCSSLIAQLYTITDDAQPETGTFSWELSGNNELDSQTSLYCWCQAGNSPSQALCAVLRGFGASHALAVALPRSEAHRGVQQVAG